MGVQVLLVSSDQAASLLARRFMRVRERSHDVSGKTPSGRMCESLLDVTLRALQRLTGMLAGYEDEALELGHEHAVLVEDARVHLDRAAILLGARGLDLEHLGLAEQR